MLRTHRDDRVAAPPHRYRMREQLFSIGDDFWIEDEHGQRAFKVDGKALRLRKTLILEGPDGRELYKIQTKLVHIRDTMEIEGSAGRVATIKKKLISPFRNRYDVDLGKAGEWAVEGNIVDHEYEIKGGGAKIAEISKKWVRVRETYDVEVGPGQDDALVLTIAVAVDQMAR